MTAILTGALPMLCGPALQRCQVLVTDGGPALVSAVAAALQSGFYPNAKARRCFWHAVTKAWSVQHSPARARADGGMGYFALDWVRHICWDAETPELAEASFDELEHWVATYEDAGPDTRAALQLWMAGVRAILPQLTLAHTTGGGRAVLHHDFAV